MNEMMINYVLLVVCVGLIIREIYLAKQKGRLRIFALLGAIVVLLLAGYATLQGMPISKLQVLIEQTFAPTVQ